MGKLRFGTSGWDYHEWIGPVYESPNQSKLATYSRIFDTAEINSSFYRKPSPGTVQGWARYSPEGFVFAAKVPQTVTHDKLMEVRAEPELREFCDLMQPLKDVGKLGPLLLQLPPRLRFDMEKVRAFLEILPKDFEFALEPRNMSWMAPEAFDLLKDQNVSYSIVDEPLLPPEVQITSSIAYIRWHGHGKDPWYDYRYSQEELQAWVPRVQDVASKTKVTYGFFNNHYHGNAPENCLEVLEMLGVATAEQRRALRRLREHREGIVRTATGRVKATTLEDFGDPGAEGLGDVASLLGTLAGDARLERGRALDGAEVKVEEVEGGVWTGSVRGYPILVDRPERRLEHECEDFRKAAGTMRLCKHLVRFFLSLPQEASVKILRDMADGKGQWITQAMTGRPGD